MQQSTTEDANAIARRAALDARTAARLIRNREPTCPAAQQGVVDAERELDCLHIAHGVELWSKGIVRSCVHPNPRVADGSIPVPPPPSVSERAHTARADVAASSRATYASLYAAFAKCAKELTRAWFTATHTARRKYASPVDLAAPRGALAELTAHFAKRSLAPPLFTEHRTLADTERNARATRTRADAACTAALALQGRPLFTERDPAYSSPQRAHRAPPAATRVSSSAGAADKAGEAQQAATTSDAEQQAASASDGNSPKGAESSAPEGAVSSAPQDAEWQHPARRHSRGGESVNGSDNSSDCTGIEKKSGAVNTEPAKFARRAAQRAKKRKSAADAAAGVVKRSHHAAKEKSDGSSSATASAKKESSSAGAQDGSAHGALSISSAAGKRARSAAKRERESSESESTSDSPYAPNKAEARRIEQLRLKRSAKRARKASASEDESAAAAAASESELPGRASPVAPKAVQVGQHGPSAEQLAAQGTAAAASAAANTAAQKEAKQAAESAASKQHAAAAAAADASKAQAALRAAYRVSHVRAPGESEQDAATGLSGASLALATILGEEINPQPEHAFDAPAAGRAGKPALRILTVKLTPAEAKQARDGNAPLDEQPSPFVRDPPLGGEQLSPPLEEASISALARIEAVIRRSTDARLRAESDKLKLEGGTDAELRHIELTKQLHGVLISTAGNNEILLALDTLHRFVIRWRKSWPLTIADALRLLRVLIADQRDFGRRASVDNIHLRPFRLTLIQCAELRGRRGAHAHKPEHAFSSERWVEAQALSQHCEKEDDRIFASLEAAAQSAQSALPLESISPTISRAAAQARLDGAQTTCSGDPATVRAGQHTYVQIVAIRQTIYNGPNTRTERDFAERHSPRFVCKAPVDLAAQFSALFEFTSSQLRRVRPTPQLRYLELLGEARSLRHASAVYARQPPLDGRLDPKVKAAISGGDPFGERPARAATAAAAAAAAQTAAAAQAAQ